MSGLFGGGGHQQPKPEIYAGLQVTTSIYGKPVPYVAGRQRVPLTLLWYGNFTVTTKAGSGGKGGGGAGNNKTYDYSASWIAALCLGGGPSGITGVNRVWHDRYLFDTGSGTTNLSKENLSLFTGADGQATWTGYPAGTPSLQQIPYSGMAYVATGTYDFGSSPSMPGINVEVEGPIGGYSDAHGIYDCDLTAFLPDYLTSPVRGAGFSGTIQSLTGTTNTVQAYCMALGLVASPLEDSQRAATDCIKETLQIMNCDCFVSVGQLNIKPLGDQAVSGTTADGVAWSWTPDFTPVFTLTDDDYCPEHGEPPVRLIQKKLNQTHNSLDITYRDRSNYYNQAPVNASIRDDIAVNGIRQMTGLTFNQITSPAVALTVATNILRADRYEVNTYEFRTDQSKSLAEPLDYISLNDSGLGLVNQVCRVLEVNEDAEGYLNFRVLKILGVIRSAPQYNWAAAAGYYANYATAPGSILSSPAPMIFQMPPIPQSLGEGITLGIAVAPAASSSFWLGCHVWMSIDGGATYVRIGTINSPAKYGTISATLAAGTADPDITSTLSVSLADTNLTLSTSITHADADAMQALSLVGTGSTAEVIAHGTASLVSAGNYNLTYLHRGLYGSKNQSHASGVPYCRLDGNLFQIAVDPGWAGGVLNFKFTSFNLWNAAEEALSAVPAYSYTVPAANAIGGAVALIPRGNCALADDGTTVYKVAGSANGWDSDAVSPAPYAQVSVSAQYGAGGALQLGLDPSVSTVGNPNPAFAIYAHADTSNTVIAEQGFAKLTLAAPVPGDLYAIVYDRYTVKYYINGVNVWSTPYPGLSLYAVVPMYEAGCVFSDVAVDWGVAATPSQWIAGSECAVNDTNAHKVSGSAAWGPGDWVASILGYKICHVTAKPNAASSGGNFMVGLTTFDQVSTLSPNNAAGAVYNYIKYGWNCSNFTAPGTNQWQVFESGVQKYNGPAPKATDVVWIAWDGTNIKYYLNDPTTPVYTSLAPPAAGTALYGIATFYDVGSGCNTLRFAPGSNLALLDTSQLGLSAATDVVVSQPANGDVPGGTVNNSGSSTAFISDVDITSVSYTNPLPIAVDVVVEYKGAFGISASNPSGITEWVFSNVSGAVSYLEGNSYLINSVSPSVQLKSGSYVVSVPAGGTITAHLEAGFQWNPFTTGTASNLNYTDVSLSIQAIKR